jgi:hypothetical protein
MNMIYNLVMNHLYVKRPKQFISGGGWECSRLYIITKQTNRIVFYTNIYMDIDRIFQCRVTSYFSLTESILVTNKKTLYWL